jgi:hypothetical protein
MLIHSLSSITSETKTRSQQRANILLALLILFFALPPLLAAQKFQLTDVTVEGTEKYSREAIATAAGLKIGAVYDEDKVSDFLKNVAPRILARAGLRFSSVSIKLDQDRDERTVSVALRFK